MFIVATAAAAVASQASITATFSLIKQALALGCFPRVKVVHTSRKYRHQIYIPDINWIVMILCIVLIAGFKTKTKLGTPLVSLSSFEHSESYFYLSAFNISKVHLV